MQASKKSPHILYFFHYILYAAVQILYKAAKDIFIAVMSSAKRNGQKEMQKKTKENSRSKRIINKNRLIYFIPLLLFLSILVLGAAEKAIPDEIYAPSNGSDLVTSGENIGVSAEVSPENEYTAKLFGIVPAKNVDRKLAETLELVPCGDVFGVKFFTKGVVITDISEVETDEGIIGPASKAGLKKGDVILKLDGKEINTSEETTKIISSSGGKELVAEFIRDGKKYKAKLTPVKASADLQYKAGMWVRDSTAGIGTVTYYNPDDGSFAGLGHGIYDSETQLLLPLLRGAVVDITLEDIIKGRNGHPGELKGTFGTEKTGSLFGNTACGVYGVLAKEPQLVCGKRPCALKSEVQKGKATILSNVDGLGVKEYDIDIVKIYSGNEETKNFVIEVTDEDLLEKTGGIVRGMSGSPILQNGKLVGAVTHVMVNDPMRGYGIFIENMLAEAEKIK